MPTPYTSLVNNMSQINVIQKSDNAGVRENGHPAHLSFVYKLEMGKPGGRMADNSIAEGHFDRTWSSVE